MKQSLILFLFALLPLAASADTVEIDGIYYNLIPKGKVAEVTSNPNDYSGTIDIPETVTYDGVTCNVTSIKEHAFFNCRDLTGINIGNYVTSIGESAFDSCTGLTSVNIGNSVISIGSTAFKGCTRLSSIDIPNSVTEIGDFAFDGCKSLTNVTIGNSVTLIGSGALRSCVKLSSVTIPHSVNTIGEKAFYGCSSLSSITIPKSVTSIGSQAFRYCSSLMNIIIGNGIKVIGDYAFGGCNDLTDVYCYAENVPSTGGDIFLGSYVEYATLHVPESALDAYKKKFSWSGFNEFVALPNFQFTYIVDGEVYKIYKYEKDRIIPVEEAPAKEGHTFSGWSEIPSVMPDHDVEVTGTFTVNTYTLTYIVDGELYKTVELEYGAEISPEAAPEKNCYTFTGWKNIPETMPAHDVMVNATYIKTSLGKCATPTISYAGGKLKFSCETEGVEYVYQVSGVDEGVSQDGEVKLKTIKVTVYAKKKDYDNSNVATAYIDARNPIGDVNGDGKVDATDVTKLIDILLGRQLII